MRLDVSKLKTNGDSEEFEFKENWVNTEFRGDILTFVDPVIFLGVATKKGNLIEVSGNIRTRIKTVCYRCTEDAYIDIDVPFYEEYAENNVPNEDDIILFEDDSINLNDQVLATIVLYLPMKYLCKDDCKGLCPKCGANLNFTVCTCEKEDIDPRWLVLKNLFEQSLKGGKKGV